MATAKKPVKGPGAGTSGGAKRPAPKKKRGLPKKPATRLSRDL